MGDAKFIKGLELSRRFFHEAIEPLLATHFPEWVYSAALIGAGSEILGFDTEMSCDHDWGPRAMIFLPTAGFEQNAPRLHALLAKNLPHRFNGYPTTFSEPTGSGAQGLDYDSNESINHRVESWTIEGFVLNHLNFDLHNEILACDWFTFPEQLLATLTAGAVFHDDLGLQAVRDRFAYYPKDVWLYLLASAWGRIEQEEHLMGRAGSVGDELGSALIAARLVRDIMRLCFLMEKKYAPYPKWFGSAFLKLDAASQLAPSLQQVLTAQSWQERESHFTPAYEYLARRHRALQITEPLPEIVSPFFDRPFLVISKGVYSAAIRAKISDPTVAAIAAQPLIGKVDQFSDSTDLLTNPSWRKALRAIYREV